MHDCLNDEGNSENHAETSGCRSPHIVGYDGDDDGDKFGEYESENSVKLDEFRIELDLESRLCRKEVKLSMADRTNFIKLSSDGYEVRNDSPSFGSIRANCYVSSMERFSFLSS